MTSDLRLVPFKDQDIHPSPAVDDPDLGMADGGRRVGPSRCLHLRRRLGFRGLSSNPARYVNTGSVGFRVPDTSFFYTCLVPDDKVVRETFI